MMGIAKTNLSLAPGCSWVPVSPPGLLLSWDPLGWPWALFLGRSKCLRVVMEVGNLV